METTERLRLPMLAAGQLQKELWLNESLLAIDLLLGGRMNAALNAAPPASPAAGCFYRVGPSAVGDWIGQDGKLAAMTAGGWRFVQPFDGLALRDSGDGTTWTFDGGAWSRGIADAVAYHANGSQVVGARQAPIAGPVGGSNVDGEARTTIVAILSALRAHGLIDS